VIGGVSVKVEGGRIVRLVTAPPVAAKVLPGPVLMLVGSAAALLAGDTVRIQLDLAPGAQLVVRSTAATIAHPCPDGGSSAVEVDGRLGAGARLVWLPEPLIVCAGCRHAGGAHLALAAGAVATWLDTIVLGRTGEQPGELVQRLDVEVDGRPLLRDALRVGAAVPGWDGPAVLGGYRHLASLHLLGRRVDEPGVMQLAGPGCTARLVAVGADELTRQVDALLPRFLLPDPPDGPSGGNGAHLGPVVAAMGPLVAG
jgi:urease accessory protein